MSLETKNLKEVRHVQDVGIWKMVASALISAVVTGAGFLILFVGDKRAIEDSVVRNSGDIGELKGDIKILVDKMHEQIVSQTRLEAMLLEYLRARAASPGEKSNGP